MTTGIFVKENFSIMSLIASFSKALFDSKAPSTSELKTYQSSWSQVKL